MTQPLLVTSKPKHASGGATRTSHMLLAAYLADRLHVVGLGRDHFHVKHRSGAI